MNANKDDFSKLLVIFKEPWITGEFVDNKVIVKGIKEDDKIEIKSADIDKLAKLLDHSDQKIKFETIKILTLFKESASPFVNDMIKDFFEYNWEQQRDIIDSFSKIKTKEMLDAYGELLDKMEKPINPFFTLIFNISEMLEEYPVEGLEIFSKIAKFDGALEVYRDVVQGALSKSNIDAEDLKLNPEAFRPPPIGMSQEQEKRRAEINISKMHLRKALKIVVELDNDPNTSNRREVKKILQTLKRLFK